MFYRSERFLRIEGVIFLPLAAAIYGQVGRPWLWLAVALVLPDVILNKRVHEHRIGRWLYDAFHTYPLPSILTFTALVTSPMFDSPLAAVAMAWFAHIGLDRLLGRGACYAGRVIDDLYAKAHVLREEAHELRRE